MHESCFLCMTRMSHVYRLRIDTKVCGRSYPQFVRNLRYAARGEDVYIHIYICICVYVHIHAARGKDVYICACVCVCMCVCVCVNVHMCMYTYMCTHTHTYIRNVSATLATHQQVSLRLISVAHIHTLSRALTSMHLSTGCRQRCGRNPSLCQRLIYEK